MLTREIAAGLVQWGARVRDAQRRVREAGQAERAGRVRYSAQCRREAFAYLVRSCGVLRMWPGTTQVGEEAVAAAQTIVLALDAGEIRKLLPLITAAAQQRRIPPATVAEATDRLCIAERRPQIYGTVTGHPIADEARAEALRAVLGMPPLAPAPLTLRTDHRPAGHAHPATKHAAASEAETAVLEDLLSGLPPVGPLPRTVRPTVGPQTAWGCGYCGGAAAPGSDELVARGRTWRVCPLCADCEDSPCQRLLDMLTAKGGLPAEVARATAALGRHEGFRLPMRYDDPRCRPNHRPQPRWHHVPDHAVETLAELAEHRRPAVTPATMPAQRSSRRVHPLLLLNNAAWEMLTGPADSPVTPLEVGRAFQLAPPTLAKRGLHVTTVAQMREIFADPPPWLLDLHRTLDAQRKANNARQLALHRPPGSSSATADGQTMSQADNEMRARVDALFSDPPPPSHLPEGAPVQRDGHQLHPGLLVSVKARALLSLPADAPLKPVDVGRALQLAWHTAHHQGLVIKTAGELAAVFTHPPQWLIDAHAILAAQRAANTHGTPGAAPSADEAFRAPHPHLLVSSRARRLIETPPGSRVTVVQVQKALQYPQLIPALEKKLARITTAGAFAALLHDPPQWLLDHHRITKAQRADQDTEPAKQ